MNSDDDGGGGGSGRERKEEGGGIGAGRDGFGCSRMRGRGRWNGGVRYLAVMTQFSRRKEGGGEEEEEAPDGQGKKMVE